MEKLFEGWQYRYVEKALYIFMTNDIKGFPPVAGQLIELTRNVMEEEFQNELKKIKRLPEPKPVIKDQDMPEWMKTPESREAYKKTDEYRIMCEEHDKNKKIKEEADLEDRRIDSKNYWDLRKKMGFEIGSSENNGTGAMRKW